HGWFAPMSRAIVRPAPRRKGRRIRRARECTARRETPGRDTLSRKPVRITTPDGVMHATYAAKTVGLVPVVGTLDEGHLSLIRRSDMENDDTVVAIFDPSGGIPDISDDDIRIAHEGGARIFYRPEQETIFPPGFSTRVHVDGLTDR